MMNPKTYFQGVEVIVVGAESGREAASRICGCENCSLEELTSFECVLDEVCPNGAAATTYVLGESLGCPNCKAPVYETTQVQLKQARLRANEWTFNWAELWLDRTNVALVDELTLTRAQHLMSACEQCADNTQIAFDYLLDAVTGCDPTQTEYLMCRRARCPNCFREVTEKMMVVPE